MIRRLLKIFSFILVFVCIIISVFFAYPALTNLNQKKIESKTQIIRIWNIDTFEGGKGSRASFLNWVAKQFEKQNKNYLIMVLSHTVTSAKTSILKGEYPDLLSYGTGGAVGCSEFLPIKNFSFKYSTQNGECYGVPWCKGGYFLFTNKEDFTNVNENNCIISEGNYSLAKVACVMESLNIYKCVQSVSAYNDFINGKYDYFIGTQRDIVRLNIRGVNYKVKPIYAFSDLYQYVSILNVENGKYSSCLKFIEFLTSKNIQEKLKNIGMMSEFFDIYDTNDVALYEYQKNKAKQGISSFCTEEVYEQISDLAEKILKGDNESVKNLKNFLI